MRLKSQTTKQNAYCAAVQKAMRAKCLPMGEMDWADVRYLFLDRKPVELAIETLVKRYEGMKPEMVRVPVWKIDGVFDYGCACHPEIVRMRIETAIENGEKNGDIKHWEAVKKGFVTNGEYTPVIYRWYLAE